MMIKLIRRLLPAALVLSVHARAASQTDAIEVPILVKETAGTGVETWPVTAVVPLPPGLFRTTDGFSLVDSSGRPVLAQFEVLNRYWASDNTIRHLKVEFFTSLSAFQGNRQEGIARFVLYGRPDPGPLQPESAAKSSPLSVRCSEGSVVVTTGPLRFEVRERPFRIIDQAWLDLDRDGAFGENERLLDSGTDHGSVLVGQRPEDVQRSGARRDVRLIVEQAGPVSVTLRAEASTRLTPGQEHLHGFAVRIKAWAGLPCVKIDYQLQNSALQTPSGLGAPLFFDSLDLCFPLRLEGEPRLRIALGNEGRWHAARGTGWRLAQQFHDRAAVCRVGAEREDAGEKVVQAQPLDTGVVDVSGARWGVAAAVRYFWQMWPNGISLDRGKRLHVELFPAWSAQWYVHGEPKGFSPTGLFWLEDMQHVYKEVLLWFHRGDLEDRQLLSLGRTFTWHPVAVVPPSWYQHTKATLDMGGLIPKVAALAENEQRRPDYKRWPKYHWDSTANGLYKCWDYFFVTRKMDVAQAGGIPHGGTRFLVSGDPADYFEEEARIIGELNVRPHWLAGYRHQLHQDSIPWVPGDLWQPRLWRRRGNSWYAQPHLPGTDQDARPRDQAHCWYYNVEEFYYFSGNPWIRDWYRFIAEQRKYYFDHPEKMCSASRGVGEVLSHAMQAYRVTGDLDLLSRIGRYVRVALRYSRDEEELQRRNLMNPWYGMRGLRTAAFQAGFLSRGLIDYLEEVDTRDPMAAATVFQALSGLVHWNLHWGNFAYYLKPGELGFSSLTSITFVDPQAWYYLKTGRRQFLEQLERYVAGGIDPVGSGKAERPLGGADWLGRTEPVWKGRWAGRYWFALRQLGAEEHPKAPAPVEEVNAIRTDQHMELRWRAPKVPVQQYHIVWSDRPITETYSADKALCNWWAAEATRVEAAATPGNWVVAKIVLGQTQAARDAYAAVFFFDRSGVLSRMSPCVRTRAR